MSPATARASFAARHTTEQLCGAVLHINFQHHACAVRRLGVQDAALLVVEKGEDTVLLRVPPCVMLPFEARCGAVREVGELVVVAAEDPEGVSSGAHADDSVQVAGGDEVVSAGVFVDAVDVEGVHWDAGGVSGEGLGHVSLVGWEMFGGPPFEKEVAGLRCRFLGRRCL